MAIDDTLEQMNLIDIFRTFHQKAKFTVFSSEHGIFSKKDNMLCHKASLNKFRKTKILSSNFSDQSVMKLEINTRRKLKETKTQGRSEGVGAGMSGRSKRWAKAQ